MYLRAAINGATFGPASRARRSLVGCDGGQRRYFGWTPLHDRYPVPVSAGVDPQDWTAGLRHFMDDGSRLVASTTLEPARRSLSPRDPSSPEPPPALLRDLDVRSAVHGLGWPLSLSIERGAAVMARLGV
jgi:hypothetical protein